MTTTATMRSKITVNGRPVDTAAATLADLIVEQGVSGKVATALNGEFVAARARERTPISPGDHVEILSARQGG